MRKHFSGLRTVIYRVPDLAKAKEWYVKAFGEKPYFDEPFYVGFEIGGYELGLHPLEPGTKHPGSGGVETYWGVEHIQAAYDHLLALGAKPVEAPHAVGDPIEVATVKDPWNNIIGLIYNPLFKVK